MNNSYSRYNTYPAGRASGSRRLSGSLSSNWISVRESRGDAAGGGMCTDNIPVCPPEKPETEMETACAPDVRKAAELAASEETASETEAAGKEDAPAMEITAETQDEVSATSAGLGAYGCLYHKGTQRLVVSQPGAAAPVHFGAHSCLNGIEHVEGDDHVVVMGAGDYEISFDLRVTAKASAPVMFELRTGSDPIPGGTFEFAISSGIRECHGGTMVRLQSGDRIRLMMTSVSVCEALLATGGVSAMLCLKKLN